MLAGELGEEAILKELRSLFAVTATGVPMGIGDDAAVIIEQPGYQPVWTTDLLLEGIHFEISWQTARELGRKSLAVNLSDLAAMAAVPRYALLAIACPPETHVEFIMELGQGFCDLAVDAGVAVIGGDTSSSPSGLLIGVVAGGFVESGGAILRSGARPGDLIMVTGFLGNAAGGLMLIKDPATGRDEFEMLRSAFVSPVVRTAASLAVRDAGATAMTDISDGLASDLKHICRESSVGALIYHEKLPVHPELKEAGERLGWNLDQMVLAGGEDYELLFTMPPENADAASEIAAGEDIQVSVIGEIVAGGDVCLLGAGGDIMDIPGHGFEHFRSGD